MKKGFLTAVIFLAVSIAVPAQKSPIFIIHGVAIRGYDPVAYFKESKPVKGDSLLLFSWNGVSWFFSSQQNLETFKADPGKFAPQYGGYCAYGMAGGHKAPVDPEAWMIVDGKLYFNYNRNVQQLWIKKQQEFIRAADKNWPVLKDKE